MLGMMGLGEVYQSKDLEEYLGSEFAVIPSLFALSQKMIDSKPYENASKEQL